MKNINWKRLNRNTHYWGSIIIAIPVLIIIISGILLLIRSEFSWIQPTTMKGIGTEPKLSFEQIFDIASQVPNSDIHSWKDISKLDVKPSKGIVKVRAKNNIEIQIDNTSGQVLQVAYRRVGIIQELHEGSFFNKHMPLWVFLPAAFILFILWVTGMYMFLRPYILKRKNNKKKIVCESKSSLPTN
ncbi:PepSY domain-containing protein [Moritella sp. 28]|uniref:PepSY domain-containing protein n=2 Tax=unclassified Moritella TaxID=2637987 RepID=UPI001BA83E1F|nr:PepSY domain-containing protein [Moritella sp. 28]QUM86175.1 PepSY domain-containing protein [Moritella sp. 28]